MDAWQTLGRLDPREAQPAIVSLTREARASLERLKRRGER
jgi:hypothetical protein